MPIQAPLYRYLNLSNSPTPFSTSRILRIATSTIPKAMPGSRQKIHIPSTSPPVLAALRSLRYSTIAVKPSTAQIVPFSHGNAMLNGPCSGTASRRRSSKPVNWSHLEISAAIGWRDGPGRVVGGDDDGEERRIRPVEMKSEVIPRIPRSGLVGNLDMKGRVRDRGRRVNIKV